MAKLTGVILLLFLGGALSQYETIQLRPDVRGIPYEKTRQEIFNNYLSNKPLLNYIPVYNTDYGHWTGEAKKPQADPQTQKPKGDPDSDLAKLNEIIGRLKSDVQTLGHQTKHTYEDKLRELNEVKKLNEYLKIALQNTDVLKHSLHQHEKQLSELTKNLQGRNEYPGGSASAEDFLKMIESLELMVRNISCKYGGRPGT